MELKLRLSEGFRESFSSAREEADCRGMARRNRDLRIEKTAKLSDGDGQLRGTRHYLNTHLT